MSAKPCPCRACVAEAIVEPTALGYTAKCIVHPDKHFAGPYRSRDKAVKEWNRQQRENSYEEG